MADNLTPKGALRAYGPRVRDDLRWLAQALKADDLDYAEQAALDAVGAATEILSAIERARAGE